MKILFITSELPFPPRRGMAVTISNFIRGLAANHEVDLLYIHKQNNPLSQEAYQTNAAQVRHFEVMSRTNDKFSGIVNELLGIKPAFAAWRLNGQFPAALKGPYDVLWAGPRLILHNAWRWGKQGIIDYKLLVAGVSDIHTANLFLKRMDMGNVGGLKAKLEQRINWLRATRMGRIEGKMLHKANLVLVQSQVELDWTAKIGGQSLQNKSMILPNGADERVWQGNMPDVSNKKLLFTGDVSTLYQNRLIWFLDSFWPTIRKAHPDASMTILGRGATPALKAKMKDRGVQHIEYIEDIGALYREHAIFVAPIFKGYGVMNKVIEALGAGCIVVGDPTAFNGMPPVHEGAYAVEAKEEADFAPAAARVMDTPEQYADMQQNARRMIQENFQWPQRFEAIDRKLKSLLNQ